MDAERPIRAAYRFDRFTLDLARGALLAEDGSELPLRPKSSALLRLLVENAGRLLDRDAIMAAVWPDVFVTDDSIAQCVRDVRCALGDGAGRLLRTVPRRGYLLGAEVSLAGPDGPPRPSADRPTSQAVAASRVERRLAAILVADVVDCSRLVGRDEAGTLARLKACRRELLEPLVARYHGRIVNFPGDNMLCEFASVVDAVECALAVQTAAAERDPEAPPDGRVVLRIGVHAGDVVSDETGEVYGDTVNIAARLEQLAEPGGVCVSERVHEEVAGRADTGFEHGGAPPLKNIMRAVGVWFWPPGDRSGRAPRLLPPADKPSIAVLP